MADATNTPVQSPDSGVPVVVTESKPGFLSTTVGKIVTGAVALIVLLGIVGLVSLLFFAGGLSGWLKPTGVTVTSTTVVASVTTTAGAEAVPIVNPTDLPLTSTFTFRNVFAPTIKATVEATESTVAAATESATPADTTPSSDSATPTVESVSTLALLRITDVGTGDAHNGVFTLNGVEYTAGNGETIGSSPWKVLEVGLDSALMLYGDVQVTIGVGQSISK